MWCLEKTIEMEKPKKPLTQDGKKSKPSSESPSKS
jgi:hypothetical protein